MSTDVGTWTNWLTFEPDPDHSPDAGTIAFSHSVCTATRNFITSGKSHVLVLGARRSSDGWFWGVETLLSEVNALYRVHFELSIFSITSRTTPTSLGVLYLICFNRDENWTAGVKILERHRPEGEPFSRTQKIIRFLTKRALMSLLWSRTCLW